MTTEIFVSYSHKDARYLKDDSLLGHLRGLERDGARFWTDTQIEGGDAWDERIKSEIKRADIALVLVSQMFLYSNYGQNDEVKSFLFRSREEGFIIFPVILSACDWQELDWLRSRQFLPGNGQNIEQHFYQPPGKRKAIFQTITDALRKRVKAVEETKRHGDAPTATAMQAFSSSLNTVNKMYPQLESFHSNQPEEHREYGVVYEGKGDHIAAKNRRDQTTLTPSDLEKLSPRQLRHIKIFQEELEDGYDRWEDLYRRRRRELPNVEPKTIEDMRRVVADMKESLDRVFAFLKAAGLQIDDHYYLFQDAIEKESRRAT